METFDNIEDARAELNEMGGVLLDLGGGTFAVLDEGVAVEMRGHLGGANYVETLAPSYDETVSPNAGQSVTEEFHTADDCTPGPWVHTGDGEIWHDLDSATSWKVARVWHSRDIHSGDAALIAAAPDLLAALEEYAVWQQSVQDDPKLGNLTDPSMARLNQARAAIDKATVPNPED